MPRIRLNAYGVSESVNLLATEINTLRPRPTARIPLAMKLAADLTSSRFQGRSDDLLINWGSSREIPERVIGNATVLNHPSCVNISANKLAALGRLSECGVKTVDWTTDIEEALRWVESGSQVFCRTELRAHSGVGIIVCSQEQPVDLGNVEWTQTLPTAPVYTKGVGILYREYRIHVFRGEILFIQQKRRANGYRNNENYSNVVRNHGNGWIYGHDNITEPDTTVLTQAIKAVDSLGLDFGAVDILSLRGESWVLEVNTAPGLTGDTNRRNYANAIVSVLEGTPVQGIREIPQVTEEESFAESIPEDTQIESIREIATGRLVTGLTVMLSPTGMGIYANSANNPHHTEGTISSNTQGGRSFNSDDYHYTVNWSNGGFNSYRDIDLQVARFPVSGVSIPAPANEDPFLDEEDVVSIEETPLETTEPVSVTATQDELNPQDGDYFVFSTRAGVKMVGEFCSQNNGFWDTRMELHLLAEVSLVKKVSLDA